MVQSLLLQPECDHLDSKRQWRLSEVPPAEVWEWLTAPLSLDNGSLLAPRHGMTSSGLLSEIDSAVQSVSMSGSMTPRCPDAASISQLMGDEQERMCFGPKNQMFQAVLNIGNGADVLRGLLQGSCLNKLAAAGPKASLC